MVYVVMNNSDKYNNTYTYYMYMQRKLEAPMPLIGMYVALASLLCSLAMAADLVHGFRSNKLWFPSKYLSLNATSLTLLSIALKLPIDLTTNMSALTDRLAKISSLSLISTAIAHLIPSLASMTADRDLLLSVTALAILILTVVADVSIQIVGTRSFLHHRFLFHQELLALLLMLLLLLLLGSTSLMVLTTNKCLETKYQEKHNLASHEFCEDAAGGGTGVVDKLRSLVNKYWVMAETSNPQFVVARSSACAAAGVICFLNALVLAQAIVRTAVAHNSLGPTGSSYGTTTRWILVVQTIGVIVGTISTSFRWFAAVRLRCSGTDDKSLRQEFIVEDYWTRKLSEYQGSTICPRIRHHQWRRLIYGARRGAVDLLLVAQVCIVLFNKLLLVTSCFITGAIIKLLKRQSTTSDVLQNVRRNSLRLQGEADLPDYMLQSIPRQVDQVLQKARRRKPSGLIAFLRESDLNFKGVAEFDSYRVPSIHGKEPKNCWSLPVVTLTSIAIAIPNVDKSKVDKLVNNVRDALVFVEMVEKSFYEKEEWKNIRKAAGIWLRVDLFYKWQEIDLVETSTTSNDCKHAVLRLARDSKSIVSEFKTDVPDCPMFNPANWPPNIIAANAMYRISSSILEGCDEESAMRDEELLEKICGVIADILGACFVNVERVIARKCHLKGIEEREKSVREAAILLGETEEILEFLEFRDLPEGVNRDYGGMYIEEWRGAMLMEKEKDKENETTSASGGITPSTCNGAVSSASESGTGTCCSTPTSISF